MKPIVTEKAVMAIEAKNTLTFEFGLTKNKKDIKKDVEELLEVKVEKVKTLVKKNKKYAYVKLKKEFLAMDVATKLGLI
ncbi:MAG: 50S ribosomal protein L23 [Nanoarchaeota archaeon]